MYKEFKPVYPDFDAVVEQCKRIADAYGNWEFNWDSQIAIQTDNDSIEDWYAGTGKSVSKTIEWEHKFNKLQPSLKGTAIDKYLQWLDVPVYEQGL